MCKIREEQNYNSLFLPEEKIVQYLNVLEKQKKDVMNQIRKIYKKNRKKIDGYSKDVGDNEVIQKLNKLELEHKLSKDLITNQIQSYDIQANPMYSNLEELKRLLDD